MAFWRRPRVVWVIAILLAVALIPLSLVFNEASGGVLGIPLYIFGVILVASWNGASVADWVRLAWRTGSRRPRVLAWFMVTGCGVTTVVWSVFLIDFWQGPSLIFPATYLVAVAISVGIPVVDRGRTRRDFYLPIYNAFGTIVVLAWWVLTFAPDPTGPAGILLHSFTRSEAILQEFSITLLAGFLPIFILPPVLVRPKSIPSLGPTSQPFPKAAGLPVRLFRRSRRVWSTVVGFGVLFAVVGQLVLFPLAYQAVAGFDSLPTPYAQTYGHVPTMQFAAVGASLTDVVAPPSDWRSLIVDEVRWATTLHLTYVRYDVQTQFLADSQGPAALAYAVAALRNASIGVILSPFGDATWSSHHPTLPQLNATIENETLLLVTEFHPDWVFPFFEPNGQVELNLGHALPPATWAGMIAAAATASKQVSPATRVLIEIADNAEGPALTRALLPIVSINAIGFDLYPTDTAQLEDPGSYPSMVVSSGKQFWVSEFGLDSIQYGEEAQARALAKVAASVSMKWNASGLCVWGMEDNAGLGIGTYHLNGFGLVTDALREKPSFAAYQYAIARILYG